MYDQREAPRIPKGSWFSLKPFTAQPLAPEEVATLKAQEIGRCQPGTLVQDFQIFLEWIGAEGVPVSGKLQHLPLKNLADLNQRLSQPLCLDLKRPQQKSYANIHGLYLLVRASGLGQLVTQGKQSQLVLNAQLYASWQRLTPTEQYFSLLEVWFLRSHPDILGEQRGGWAMVGEHCLRSWPALAPEGSQAIADEQAQTELSYTVEFYNLMLMELFGFLTLTYEPPQPGKGWRITRLQRQPWGIALMKVLINSYSQEVFPQPHPTTLDPYRPLGDLQAVIQPYQPTWQQCLAAPRREVRSGRYVFKVSLGPCWRRISVSAAATLMDFSRGILDSVGFDFDHLDKFEGRLSDGRLFVAYHPALERPPSTEQVRLGDLPLGVGSALVYVFDFVGQKWRFDMILEDIVVESESRIMQATKGKKRKPPLGPTHLLAAHGNAPEQYPPEDALGDAWQ